MKHDEQRNYIVGNHYSRRDGGVTGVGPNLQLCRKLGTRSSSHKTTPKGSNPLPLHHLILKLNAI